MVKYDAIFAAQV